MRGRAGWLVAATAFGAAVLVHRRFAWIPEAYLLALVALPMLGWRAAVWRAGPRSIRWSAPILASLVFLALLPVPWMTATIDDPPGSAWRLDGRLSIDGERVDPPGTWLWLTVGRPPIVAELLRSWVVGSESNRPVSLLAGSRASRPAFSEPAAAAVGLRRAGWPLRTRIIVEVSDPLDELLPTQAVLAQVNGLALTTREDWTSALDHLSEVNVFEVEGGERFQFTGTALPFGRVDVIELPDDDLAVRIGGGLAETLPGSWYRNLSLGSSHGLMVALVAYVHAADDDLARGRTIAGTGKMLADGTVGTIGGLRAKATAARDAHADVLLFPAKQADQLDGFVAGQMQLIPVASLDEAIAALR